MRTAFRWFAILQTLLLAGFVVAGGVFFAQKIEYLPAVIAGVSFGLTILSVYPFVMIPAAVLPLHTRLAKTRLVQGGIARHSPFQFGAVSLVLLVALAASLPDWVPQAVAEAVAEFHRSIAERGACGTLWIFGCVSVLGTLVVLALGTFAVFTVVAAIRPEATRHTDAEQANMTVLWNVALTIIFLFAEIPTVFESAPVGPAHARWWFLLAISVALSRRVLVLVMLLADHYLGGTMHSQLSARVAPHRISASVAGVALGAAAAAYLSLKAELGVATSIAAIAMTTGPASWLLERIRPAALRIRIDHRETNHHPR